ncbi:glyoxalase family protein [Arthrobacter alpinus]|uniref:Glyoxalase family protein n=1 Tax=Arthrobacter alpinus TaxID=656366 RepID=A0A0S2M360_9MICC|nr:VOC family protein [Arthrobacter alpinus]ALO68111.1 glyoxalase family protein [Arthrobacter alpinus]
MQRIVPNVWCQGNAVEVGEFYAAVLPQSSATTTMNYPTEGLLDFQRDFAGQALVVDVSVRGYQIRLINAGNEFRPTPAISFILNTDPLLFDGGEDEARTSIHSIWEAFAEGGQVRMELDEYPFSKLYGWVEDRFGVNWQLMLSDPAGDRRPFVIPQFLFTGPVAQAQQAIELYTGLLADSSIGMLMPHQDEAAGIMFAEFNLAGQWFSGMDAGTDHHFTFSPGLSLEVSCADQEEIDRLWEVLSSVPEAEQCGWVVDRFGVSWQIVPENMGELMQHPGAFSRMLEMKKIIMAEL